MKKELLKLKMDGYLKDGDIYEDKHFPALVSYYINKARHNLMTANLIKEISENAQLKRSLSVADDYSAFDWVIVAAYYAMFHMATALLGSVGLRARSHESLINAIEYQFVYKENLLETEFIKNLSQAKRLEEQYVNRLWAAKSKRTVAHYKAEKEISKKDAINLLNTSAKFIDRLYEIILQLKEK